MDPIAISRAAALVAEADAFLFTAGAGMGVDSGLPDFRGDEGFWKAYPPFKKLGLGFVDLANPDWFHSDPALAWGFYGHRLMLYRRTVPHAGFTILKRWAAQAAHGAFVMTSNVDGQFQRAGFDPALIYECHGAIDFLQCTRGCGAGIFPADGTDVHVDGTSFRAMDPLPTCPSCGALARPNILMFGDGEWDEQRSDAQSARLQTWCSEVRDVRARVVVVECGAGTALPTVRRFSESAARQLSGTLIRINPREMQVPHGQIGLDAGALAGLQAIDKAMRG